MDAKLYGLLVDTARHRETTAYRETHKRRAVIGPLLDEINRHEVLEGRPLLSVIVVHKGATEPGDMFLGCAEDLKRYRPSDNKRKFVDQEGEAVYKTWAG